MAGLETADPPLETDDAARETVAGTWVRESDADTAIPLPNPTFALPREAEVARETAVDGRDRCPAVGKFRMALLLVFDPPPPPPPAMSKNNDPGDGGATLFCLRELTGQRICALIEGLSLASRLPADAGLDRLALCPVPLAYPPPRSSAADTPFTAAPRPTADTLPPADDPASCASRDRRLAVSFASFCSRS